MVSAKESFYKALYPRVRRIPDFDVLCLESISVEHSKVMFLLRQTLDESFQQGQWTQDVSIGYRERMAEAGIEPSAGSKGDSYDNAFAETTNGL